MKRLILTLAALLGFVFWGFSQTEKLTGKILNSKNDPVIGATIQIEGSNTGAASDVDRNFSLSLSVRKKYTLVISSVNYETKAISVRLTAATADIHFLNAPNHQIARSTVLP